MKHSKKAYLVTALVILFTFSLPCQAENSDGYGEHFQDKLGHGFANMTTGFIEIPKNIINITEDSGFLVGITLGTFRGIFHGVGRTLIGVADFLTSPFPTTDYVTPGLPWERFSEDTRYFKFSYPGQWTSFGENSNLEPLGAHEGDDLRME